MQSLSQVQQLLQSAQHLFTKAKTQFNPQQAQQALLDLEHAERKFHDSQVHTNEPNAEMETMRHQIKELKDDVRQLIQNVK